MTLTNRNGFPEPLVRAIASHEHQGADYSASMLANSPRQVWLRKRHEAEATQDVAELMWAAFGTAFHTLMQGGTGENQLAEQYMVEEVLGVKLSGIADLYDGDRCALWDFKTTSAWTLIYHSHDADWAKQLNTYAWMYRRHGFEVKELRILAALRDWMPSKAAADGNYPQAQAVVVNVDLWPEEKADAYIKERIALHESHKATPDDHLPSCTDEERWARAGKPPARCDRYCLGVAWCLQRQSELANAPAVEAKPKRVKKGAS